MAGDNGEMLPLIAKQTRQKQRLKANNAQLRQKLDETEDELQQAIETNNWNYTRGMEALRKFEEEKGKVRELQQDLKALHGHMRQVSDSRDRQDAERLAWKRTIHDLHQEGMIPLSAASILQRQTQHLQEASAEIRDARVDRRGNDKTLPPVRNDSGKAFGRPFYGLREKAIEIEAAIMTQEPEFGEVDSDKLREATDRGDEQEAQRLAWKQTLSDLYEAGHITLPREDILAQQEKRLEEKRDEIKTARAEKRGEAEAADPEGEAEDESGPSPRA